MWRGMWREMWECGGFYHGNRGKRKEFLFVWTRGGGRCFCGRRIFCHAVRTHNSGEKGAGAGRAVARAWFDRALGVVRAGDGGRATGEFLFTTEARRDTEGGGEDNGREWTPMDGNFSEEMVLFVFVCLFAAQNLFFRFCFPVSSRRSSFERRSTLVPDGQVVHLFFCAVAAANQPRETE